MRNFYPVVVSINVNDNDNAGVDIDVNVSHVGFDDIGVKLISKSLTGQKKLTDKEMKSDFCVKGVDFCSKQKNLTLDFRSKITLIKAE